MLDWLKGAALVAFIGLCLMVTVDEHRTSKHLDNLLMASTDTVEVAGTQIPLVRLDIATATQTLASTVTGIRSDLKPLLRQANLDLEESHRLILEAGLTTTEMRKAAIEERAALPALTQGAQNSLTAFNANMVALQGLIKSGTTLVSDPHISGLIAHTDGLVGHAEAITGDAQIVADKETKDFQKPVPWYMWPFKRSGEILDIGAFAARHAP